MTKNNPVEIQENDLDGINGGLSWGASNPDPFKNSDGILRTKSGQTNGVVLGQDGNDLLIVNNGDGSD